MSLSSKFNTATAQYLDQAGQVLEQYFRESVRFSKQPALNELAAVWEEYKFPNWDGYDALPVQSNALAYAYLIIRALPLGSPLPSVGAEPDGHLTLEWYRHPRWILSVSIGPEGTLYYAALFGNSDVRESEPFFGNIPKSILNLIQRVRPA
ncbi:hypothetical protein IQ254_19680 [Nodosilinea sp. LEGE 07088]|uniref:hypothetical protein n=1 Tax=Nodosilinea sp. LEGE 07088 TaxID=2777968 RepID=UPI00187F3784|nr:hypothetical protein [Nodosilinea sp. LEGE 07088]MBE9139389.1 hypothetical protein [Nodosilinea sp. LEGE 07088]